MSDRGKMLIDVAWADKCHYISFIGGHLWWYEEVPVLDQWETPSFTPSYKSLWSIQILLINALLTNNK